MSMPVRSARQNSNRAGTEGAPHRLRRPSALAPSRAMLRAVGVTALVLSSLFASTVWAADARVERLAHSGTIYRDSYGVPHVYGPTDASRSEEHTSELQSRSDLVCRLLLEKKKNTLAAPMEISIMASPARPW